MTEDAHGRWDAYEKLVLNELERHAEEIKSLNEKIYNLAKELVHLKERATTIGGILIGVVTLSGLLGGLLKIVVF